jgi:hypothetical protein
MIQLSTSGICLKEMKYEDTTGNLKILISNNDKELKASQATVAHICNPSYSGGRDQEGYGLKPTQANNSQDPILKKPSAKQGW